MIRSILFCLTNEHTKLDEQILQLALAATRLAADPNDDEANRQTVDMWEGIQGYLWSHLQIEDELVMVWGDAHHAIPGALGKTLENERQEIRKLLAGPASYTDDRGTPRNSADREGFARTLLGVSRTLSAHVERYEGEVLPAIQRALFH
jgi:Hemerythrin HHE cation binding domain